MISVKSKDMATFLKRVYLGGVIEDCVLQTTPEGMCVQALDLSNTLLLSVAAPFEATLNAGNLGISLLDWLIKALGSFGDGQIEMGIEGNRLIMRGAGNSLKYLLSSAEAVPTMPEDPAALATVKDALVYSVKLDDLNKGNLTTNISLFKKPTVTVNINANNGKGTCSVVCGAETENQFTVQFGRVTVAEGAEIMPLSFEVNAAHVKACLEATSSGEGTPLMMMAANPKYPVIICQGMDLWGFLPAVARPSGGA